MKRLFGAMTLAILAATFGVSMSSTVQADEQLWTRKDEACPTGSICEKTSCKACYGGGCEQCEAQYCNGEGCLPVVES